MYPSYNKCSKLFISFVNLIISILQYRVPYNIFYIFSHDTIMKLYFLKCRILFIMLNLSIPCIKAILSEICKTCWKCTCQNVLKNIITFVSQYVIKLFFRF